MNWRRIATWGGGIALALAVGAILYSLTAFPSDTTPEGAYLRIARSLGGGESRVVFSYLEDEAQHAAFTIIDYRKKSLGAIEEAYPEPERTHMADQMRPVATLGDGADLWERMAHDRGWVAQLRRDLSGIERVEIVGERATVITARGSRYAFRRRSNGMWGLTLFTAELLAEAERAARDYDVVDKAAADYRRAAAHPP